MSTFTFRAVDLEGAPARGEVEASNRQAVTEQLRERGLIPLDIVEEKATATNYDLLEQFKKVKSKDITVMTRQLATMVASGMSLLRCFYVLEEQTENDKLKEIIAEVRRDIETGMSLSVALEKHPKVFNRLYVAMVHTGESSGMLEESLVRVADQLESADSLRRQIRSAMVYPALIGGFALVVLLALVAFLIPVFEKVFTDFGGELPAITKVSVAASHAVTGQWYLLILGTVGIIVGFIKWKKSSWGGPMWDKFKLRIPMKIGDTVQKVSLARWSRTFAGLVHAGVPILQAVEITGATSGSHVIETAMADVYDSIKRGGTVAEPLRASAAFPTMVAHMVGVGEETGNLDGMLEKIADFYEDEVAAAVKALTSILEPIMILFVGGIVGFVVISMYMPMFKVYDNIK
ncbi:MAG: type II secretion system F family protein [Solirubrobacterales bacterium]